MKLPGCHLRGAILGDRCACSCTRLITRGGTVPLDFCESTCPYVDLDNPSETPPPIVIDTSCPHRGPAIRTHQCKPCGGARQIEVFACTHPDQVARGVTECSILSGGELRVGDVATAPRVACCMACDFLPRGQPARD